jgi:hypothetical protein
MLRRRETQILPPIYHLFRGLQRKVIFFICSCVRDVLINHRVIISCVRDRGYCPCPRCGIPATRFQNLGMVLDMKQRSRLARVDDQSTRKKIELARSIIYEKNFAIDTNAVEELLKDESLTPTLVCLESFDGGPPIYL